MHRLAFDNIENKQKTFVSDQQRDKRSWVFSLYSFEKMSIWTDVVFYCSASGHELLSMVSRKKQTFRTGNHQVRGEMLVTILTTATRERLVLLVFYMYVKLMKTRKGEERRHARLVIEVDIFCEPNCTIDSKSFVLRLLRREKIRSANLLSSVFVRSTIQTGEQ